MSMDNRDFKTFETAVLAGNLDEIDRFTRNQDNSNKAFYNILKKAIAAKKIEAANLLISRGCPVSESSYSHSNEILHLAIVAGDIGLVQLLVNRQISTKNPDKDGIPPLFKIVDISDSNVDYDKFLDCLLANENTRFINGKHQNRAFSVLHYAAEKGNPDIISHLMSRRSQLNAKSADGSTAVHIAAKNRHAMTVRRLLQNGLKDSLTNNAGKLPLYYAIENGDFETYEVFLNYGRYTALQRKRYLQKHSHEALVYLATSAGSSKIVESLLINQVSPDDDFSKGLKRTAIYLAIEKEDVEIVKLLLRFEASLDQVDDNDYKPLHFACIKGNLEIITVFLNSPKCKINCKTEEGLTSLHLAAREDNPRVVSLLLERGASCKEFDENKTPLSVALENTSGDGQSLILILEHIRLAERKRLEFERKYEAQLEEERRNEAKLEAERQKEAQKEIEKQNEIIVKTEVESEVKMEVDERSENEQRTEISTEIGPITEVKCEIKMEIEEDNHPQTEDNDPLLQPNDNLLITYHTEARNDENGNTALHLAVEKEDSNVVSLLLEYQACINKLNKNRQTPLDVATINGSFKIVNIFLENAKPETLFVSFREDGFTPMHFAVIQGNIDMLEVFLKAGISVDLPLKSATLCYPPSKTVISYSSFVSNHIIRKSEIAESKGLTPLHVAVWKNDKKLVLLLLENGAKVDVPGRTCYETPLFTAAEKGNAEIFEILAEASTTRSSEWKEGYLPMYIAAYRGHEEIVRMLLDKGVNPNDNVEKYLTPLHAAAHQGHENIVALLLDRGAFVNPKRHYYAEGFVSTPLLAAAHAKHSRIVQLLLDRGADFNAEIKPISVDPAPKPSESSGESSELKGSKESSTASSEPTAENSHPDSIQSVSIIDQILQRGTYKIHEIGREGSLLGYRVLHFAVEAGDAGVIQTLIRSGASLNFAARNGATAIGLAIENEDSEILKLLLSAGANIFAEHKARPILSIKVLKTNATIAETVVRYVSASQPAAIGNNVTPLGIAVENELEACVKKLLEVQASVHIEHKGKPLLHLAIKLKNCTIVKLLMKHGVNINYCVENTGTALLIAIKNEIPSIVELLLNAGVETTIPRPDFRYHLSPNEYVPLNVAIDKKNAEIVDMFLKRGLVDSNYDSTFQMALKKSSPQVVEKFIFHGASIDANDEKNECPIFYAISGNNLEVLQYLLKMGASINATTIKGETILSFAVKEGISKELFQCLVDHGIDVNTKIDENDLPLHWVLNKIKHWYSRYEWLLPILLENGTNPNQVDMSQGKTTLQLVIEDENVKFLKLFLLNGADVNFLNVKNETALKVAMDRATKRCADYESRMVPASNPISKELDNLAYDKFLINGNSELRDKQILPARNIVRLLIQEIIRRCFAKLEVSKENRVLAFTPQLAKYVQRCRNEIFLMKKTKICEGVTYFDILVTNTNGLAELARNVLVKKILLNESNVTKTFPEYGDFLIQRIVIGRDRRYLFDSNYRLLKDFLHFDFPTLVVDHIFGYLTNKELKSLRIAKDMFSS